MHGREVVFVDKQHGVSMWWCNVTPIRYAGHPHHTTTYKRKKVASYLLYTVDMKAIFPSSDVKAASDYPLIYQVKLSLAIYYPMYHR